MKKIDDLRNQLNEVYAEIEKPVNQTYEKMKEFNDKIDFLNEAIKAELKKPNPEPVDDPEPTNKASISEIFAKAIAGRANSSELAEIKNLMVEEEKSKGGITVPDDVKTSIIELQRGRFDIRKYINIEPVSTMKGTRPIEGNEPEASGFASLDEGADIQALHEPIYEELDYKVRKYAGFIPVTNELLEDSAQSILSLVEKWMAKNELNTYAYQVFNGTGDKSATGIITEATKEGGALVNTVEKVDVTPTIKKFKSVFNKDLDEIDSDNICIFTNSDGYDFIDGLEDKNGKPYLQPDVTKASGYVFLGKEIVKVPTKFLGEVSEGDINRVPFIIGDLKLLYTMYDRKQMSVESTKIGGDAWRKEKTEVKGVFRFDGQLIDKAAVKILLVDKSKLV